MIFEVIANVKDKTGGDLPSVEGDKTKKPVSDAVWAAARPVMHAVADVSSRRPANVHGAFTSVGLTRSSSWIRMRGSAMP
jgi:hypothetical protein